MYVPHPITITITITLRLQEKRTLYSQIPPGSNFKIRLPSSSKFLLWNEDDLTLDRMKVELTELIHDKFLYSAFLSYLQSIYSSENLLCLRSISVYHCLWVDQDRPKDRLGCPDGAEEAGWKVYLFFIAVGSAFEISVSHQQRKELLLGLSCPSMQMFDKIEKVTQDYLTHHLRDFYSTHFFESVPSKVINEIKNFKASNSKCLSWI